MQEMSEELERNKSIISREINRHCEEKWSPEEVAGYIKENDIKFDIQPSFQLIYYWIERKKINISPLDLVHKAKIEWKNIQMSA